MLGAVLDCGEGYHYIPYGESAPPLLPLYIGFICSKADSARVAIAATPLAAVVEGQRCY